MATLINRGLSLLIYCGYLALAFTVGGPFAALKVAMFLLLPLACIWFPEPLGDYAGNLRGHQVTRSSPAFLVCAMGWVILVGVPIIVGVLNAGR